MKTISTFFLLLLVSFSYAQMCTIDYSQNTPGIYPAVTPNGTKGIPYSEEITVLFPSADAGVNYSSFKISSVELPMGLSWECNNEAVDCVYNAQQNPFACIRVFGTPGESGQFVVNVIADATQTNNIESVYSIEADLEIIISSGANGIFTTTPILGCETTQVDFTLINPVNYTPIPNQTTGIAHNWDFGNGFVSNLESPLSQTFTGAGEYTVTHTEILDTVGFKLQDVTINTVGCTDAPGWGNPDIYIEMYDASNTMVYTTISNLNDSNLPITIPVNLLLNNPPYQIRVMDDDSDNVWGTAPDNCVNGTGDSQVKTAINLPSVGDFGTTIQIGSNGSLNFTYAIYKDTIHNVSTDTVTVFANPSQPSIVADMNSPITLSTVDLGYTYHWNKDNVRIHSLRGTEVHPQETGSYSLTAVNENGCYSASSEEVIDFTGLEELSAVIFNMYPNPASHSVNIVFAEKLSNAEVFITDLSGRVLNQRFIVDQDVLEFDVSALASGVYTIAIVNKEGHVSTKKLIVQ